MFVVDGCENLRKRWGLMYLLSELTHALTVLVRVVLLVAGMFEWFLAEIDEKTVFFHVALEGQEEVCVRTPIWFWHKVSGSNGHCGD